MQMLTSKSENRTYPVGPAKLTNSTFFVIIYLMFEMNSRYVPVAQKPFCCVPACLQMILNKHGINPPTQDMLGYHLGLVVPPEKADKFSPVRIGSGPEAGTGTRIFEPEYNFNTVAERLGWGLEFLFTSPDDLTMKGLADYLSEGEAEDRDAIVSIDYRTLYRTKETSSHVSLFDGISGDTVQLVDPAVIAGIASQIRQVNISTLLTAMQNNSPWMGGLWEIILV